MKKFNLGAISLLEILLTIIIITVILMQAAKYFIIVQKKAQDTALVAFIKEVKTAGYEWLKTKNYASFKDAYAQGEMVTLKKLVDGKFLSEQYQPTQSNNCITKNRNLSPWHNSQLYICPQINSYFSLAIMNLPASDCVNTITEIVGHDPEIWGPDMGKPSCQNVSPNTAHLMMFLDEKPTTK